MTTGSTPPVRIARHAGTCGAPGCRAQIWPGSPIIKPPGKAWRHEDCDHPGRRGMPRDQYGAVVKARRR